MSRPGISDPPNGRPRDTMHPMTSKDDGRPLAAAGHVSMRAHPVEAAARRLEAVGVRTILVREDFASSCAISRERGRPRPAST